MSPTHDTLLLCVKPRELKKVYDSKTLSSRFITAPGLDPCSLNPGSSQIRLQAVEILSETIASSKWRGSSVLGPVLEESLGPRGLRALDRRNDKVAMRRLLRSVASNLCMRGQDLTTPCDALLGREVMAFLCPTAQQSCWQVQVKAAEFGEDLPERLADPGYFRFRRQVHLADRLFGSCADEAILELVDSQMLRDGSEGSHDECWTKMPRISLWPSLPVARAAEPIRALIGELSLNQKLAYILGRSLAQEVPWDDSLPDSILELCRSQLRQLWEDLQDSSKTAPRVDLEALADLAEKISACACFKPDGVLETVVEELFLATIADLMYFRFAILLDVNWLVRNSLLPFVDLAPSPQTALDRLLRQQKPRLLGHLKYARFQQVLKQTRFDGSSPTITLNRKLALSIKEHDRVDWDLRRSLTGQFLNEIRRLSLGPKLFRRPWLTRAVKVQFKGEGGEDAGGLYREALEAVVRELTSRSLPLLLPCPNAVAEVGENRDCWILNPSATSSTALAGLEFMGQLMGGSAEIL
ncbi:HERC2 [Symbiodinium sp. CCMP2592]|nr:HERC2 [Symbiodinium sp. CCMP2592]